MHDHHFCHHSMLLQSSNTHRCTTSPPDDVGGEARVELEGAMVLERFHRAVSSTSVGHFALCIRLHLCSTQVMHAQVMCARSP